MDDFDKKLKEYIDLQEKLGFKDKFSYNYAIKILKEKTWDDKMNFLLENSREMYEKDIEFRKNLGIIDLELEKIEEKSKKETSFLEKLWMFFIWLFIWKNWFD